MGEIPKFFLVIIMISDNACMVVLTIACLYVSVHLSVLLAARCKSSRSRSSFRDQHTDDSDDTPDGVTAKNEYSCRVETATRLPRTMSPSVSQIRKDSTTKEKMKDLIDNQLGSMVTNTPKGHLIRFATRDSRRHFWVLKMYSNGEPYMGRKFVFSSKRVGRYFEKFLLEEERPERLTKQEEAELADIWKSPWDPRSLWQKK